VGGAVNLDRIEELAVVFELVYLARGIEITCPGTLALGVGPAGSTDVNLGIMRHIFHSNI